MEAYPQHGPGEGQDGSDYLPPQPQEALLQEEEFTGITALLLENLRQYLFSSKIRILDPFHLPQIHVTLVIPGDPPGDVTVDTAADISRSSPYCFVSGQWAIEHCLHQQPIPREKLPGIQQCFPGHSLTHFVEVKHLKSLPYGIWRRNLSVLVDDNRSPHLPPVSLSGRLLLKNAASQMLLDFGTWMNNFIHPDIANSVIREANNTLPVMTRAPPREGRGYSATRSVADAEVSILDEPFDLASGTSFAREEAFWGAPSPGRDYFP
ncbi:hypothetical protein GGS23DRAFT_148359 [Durotheca rogersii]|uniref:uncharacterized protein n=1 Tax=Durotheca rogersii TaxID=419775 RepID=UPI00221F76CE|nr:uncharacterized protein GGS23DRAFT_148359 [Durotheca rogersii]KAI5861374.1 hypothetical protein GGS23DRAFT_148359 [Durotheca rogersii]